MVTDDERREVARSCDRCEYRPVCSTRRTCGDSAWCCSTYKQRIDRDALLALADEMETADPEDLDVAIDYVTECASRIREACGEEDA